MNEMSVEQFLLMLKDKDIKLWLDGERLRVSAAKDAMTPELRDDMASRKQQIIDFLSAAATGADSNIPEIVAVRDGSPAPLSFGQQRSWLLHELNKDQSVSYDTLTYNLRMHGQLDVDALKFSLSQIVRRHEILRSYVGYHQDQPVQHVLEVDNIQLERKYFSDEEGLDLETYARQVLSQAKQTLFDPATGPLFRMQLVELECDNQKLNDHILILIMHHMIFDGWSIAILTRELMQSYQEYQQGEREESVEPALQYSDFSRWQRQWLQGDELDRFLGYWKQQLDGIATLGLPIDKPRPPLQTYNGGIQGIKLSAELSKNLVGIAKANDATLFMLMLSSLGLLLSRYSGQNDVAIGTPITSRDRTELQDLIGFFLNTLVMRLDYSGEANFLDLLTRCRKTCLDAFSHQHLPFEKLVEELKLERDQSSTPLFQVMFMLDGAPDSNPMKLEGLQLNSMQDAVTSTRFDLEVSVIEGDDGLVISFTYNTDLFEDNTINSMLNHFQILLESIVAETKQPAYTLPLLDDKEIQYLQSQPTQMQRDYDLDTTLTEMFEKQVDSSPDSIALIFENERLSYLEMDQRVNQLAHCLRDNNIGVGDYVAVFCDRSLELVIALYAIHKAGAAYVPLDPEYPAGRLSWMIEDTQTKLILSQSHLLEKLPDNNATVISLDGDNWQENIAGYSQSRLALTAKSDDAAYVIYTSGSTGKPKGVINTHSGVVNLLLWMQEAYQLTAEDCDLQKTPFSFDVSVLELFWPLVNGSRLVVARPDGHKDPEYIISMLSEHHISTLHFVPSMLRAFLDNVALENITTLKRVICIGEVLPYDLQQQFFKASSAQLLNLYGPTEAAVIVSHWTCQRDNERRVIPIGYPIANTSLYVLDEHCQPVPVGVAGELHIGGVQVAKGYLNRQQLTAEKFIANPFNKNDGIDARLYKTGDRARCLEDGSIEYLARIDNQVKLRGFRIELGEVEVSLCEHEAVSQAAAIIREDKPGDKRLVAYLIAASGDYADQAELLNPAILDHLKSYLPIYMVPSHIVWVDSFPSTANGKINFSAFPQPVRVQKQAVNPGNKPETDMEIVMVKIWEDLLELDDIETIDMFFDLGGNSLLTLKVVERFKAETGIKISPLSLINQTLHQLAAGAERAADTTVDSTADTASNTAGNTAGNKAAEDSSSGVLGSIKKSLFNRG